MPTAAQCLEYTYMSEAIALGLPSSHKPNEMLEHASFAHHHILSMQHAPYIYNYQQYYYYYYWLPPGFTPVGAS